MIDFIYFIFEMMDFVDILFYFIKNYKNSVLRLLIDQCNDLFIVILEGVIEGKMEFNEVYKK